MHPNLLSELATIRQADLLAEAERERLARTAKSTRGTSNEAMSGRSPVLSGVAALLVFLVCVGAILAGVDVDGGVASVRSSLLSLLV
jgi:hypothetical protein